MVNRDRNAGDGKYNSVARGVGARYAFGFAVALHDQAEQQAQHRRAVVTPATRALTLKGETLAELLVQKKNKAEKWLTTEHNVKLGAGCKRGYGGCAGGTDAFATGRSDGKRADFEAKRQRKIAGG